MTTQNPPAPDRQHPAPGRDEIVLTEPATGQLCSSLEHRRAGQPAQVVVTMGQMGAADYHRDAVWPECWGKSYPMCGPCWEATRQVAQARRPGLVITDTTTAPAG
jgi:hypothetical protein